MCRSPADLDAWGHRGTHVPGQRSAVQFVVWRNPATLVVGLWGVLELGPVLGVVPEHDHCAGLVGQLV